MTDLYDERNFETLLAEERPRLVRLCAWFTGSPEAADDLAQETLIAAWKSRAQLISPEKFRAWSGAIARNVCLNWLRQHRSEQARLAPAADGQGESPEEALPGDLSPEHALDRQELAHLLNRALALLPAETAQMLVEHYIHQAPQAELAAKFGLKTGTVAVRLQRGKLTLQKALRGKLLAEPPALDGMQAGVPVWQETNIWCPMCGKRRLLGQYQREGATGSGGRFALRCPACCPDPQSCMVGLDLSIPRHARLLEGVKTFKPAYTRLKTFIADFYRQALATNDARCPACGGRVGVHVAHDVAAPRSPDRRSELTALCARCGWVSNSSLTGLVLALPEVQQFWRENPRMRTLPAEEVETQGALAIVTRMQSLDGAAALAVISRRDTLEAIGVHASPRL